MNRNELEQSIAYVGAVLRQMHADHEERSMDEATQASFDEGVEAVRGWQAQLDALAVREAEVRRLAEGGATVPAVAPNVIVRQDPYDAEVTHLRPQEARDRAFAALEAHPMRDEALTSAQQDKLDRLIRSTDVNCNGATIAKRFLVTERPEYRTGWMKAMTSPTPALTPEEARALAEYRAASIGVDTAGGFGVPVIIDPTIILTGQESLNPFREISRVITITNDEWKGVSSAGVTWSYDAEGVEVSDDSPTLAQPSVAAHMARGFVPFSIEVGMDYPGFAMEMSRLLAEGYNELQASAFATGTGSGQPYGILTALDANTNVEVTPTTDGTFTGTDVNKVWGELPDRAKANATWVMSHDVGDEVDSFGASNNLSFVTVNLTGVGKTLKERPVKFSSHFPSFTGTTGARNILVVGDFSRYVIVERAGMSVELVPHLLSTTTNLPNGQRGWFAWARHGADSIDDLRFRLLQNQ